MKKALATIAILGAAGAAAFFAFQKIGPSGSFSAATLLPPETIVMIEAPDLKTSAERWQKTAIFRIANEPEVQTFFQRPLAAMRNTVLEDTLRRLHQVSLDQGFVAMTSIEDNNPVILMGIRYSGSREELQGLVARAKAQAQTVNPTGKLDLIQHGPYEIESFTYEKTTVAGVYAGQWYFISNQVDLLKATLDRLTQPAGSNLEGSEIFRKCMAALPKKADLRTYIRTDWLAEKYTTLMQAAGTPLNKEQLEELRQVKGVAVGTVMEGPLIREVAYVYAPEMPILPVLNGSTLALTSPDTLIYYGNALNFPENFDFKNYPANDPVSVALRSFLKNVDSEVPLSDLKKAFGPDFAFILDWKKQSISPSMAVVVTVKDAPLAFKFARSFFRDWKGVENGAVAFWRLPRPNLALPLAVAPTAAMTDTHLIVGIDSHTVDAILEKAIATVSRSNESKTLILTPAFEKAYASVHKPAQGLIYVDTRVLFERIYETFRGMAVYANMIPGASEYFDFSRLPTTDSISQHLLPNIVSTAQVENGILVEATGALSVQGTVLLKLGLAGALYAKQLRQ